MISAIAVAILGAMLAPSYPARITFTQGGQHLADFNLPLIAGQTARDSSGSDLDLTTVWLTPSPESDGRVRLHIVTERESKNAATRQVLKTATEVVLSATHGRLRIKLDAESGGGNTEIVIALGGGTSTALEVPKAS